MSWKNCYFMCGMIKGLLAVSIKTFSYVFKRKIESASLRNEFPKICPDESSSAGPGLMAWLLLYSGRKFQSSVT